MNSDQLLKYISGDLPKEERREVYSWIRSSKENLAEYRAMRRLYDISLWNEPQARVRSRARIRTYALSFAFAAVLALVGGVMFFVGKDSNAQQPLLLRSVTAPMGKEVNMDLADGTKVWLNSGSTLTVNPETKDGVRRVTLRGEGYFKVAPDPEHPFIVETGGLNIKVLGTEFNVKSYPEKGEWSTALVKGSIAILDKNENELLRVAPGTLTSLVKGKLVSSVMKSDNYLWKDGIIYFDDIPLSEIFKRLADYYDIKFDTSACHKLSKHYTGKFRTVDGYDHILKVLKIDSNFSYKIQHESGLTTISIKD